MYCKDCGAQNQENAQFCMKCGNTLISKPKNKKVSVKVKFEDDNISFKSIKWAIVLPISIAIGLLGAASMGPIFLLIVIVGLTLVGYLVKEPKKGVLNGLITGAISFSIGAITSGNGMGIVVFALGGVLFGAIFGGFGGYIKKIK